MSRRGPHELTLADIAGEAGVTAGRLVQRFGSKRDLLVALSARFAGERRPGLRGTAGRPPQPARDAAGVCGLHGGSGADAGGAAAQPGLPAADLADDVLRGHLVENARATRREIETLLEAAADGRRAAARRRRALARAHRRNRHQWLADVLGHVPRRQAVDWIGRDLEAVLAPWLRRSRDRGPAVSARKRSNGPPRRPVRGG